MSKQELVNRLILQGIETSVKYHSPLTEELLQWYVYTRETGHRLLCVPKSAVVDNMVEEDYNDRLVSAAVKSVLRGYSFRDGFIIADMEYDPVKGFITEDEDREFDPAARSVKRQLRVGELYLPGTTSWPEEVEYNYFGGKHELRFILKNPSRYVTEVIKKMPLTLGLYARNDIILLAYRFTDYKKKLVPVHGYSPFSIHLVPENLRTVPELPGGTEHEEVLNIHLVDADTGILKAARSAVMSHEFTAALCTAIVEQSRLPFAEDYNDRLRELDGMFPDTDAIFESCLARCSC